MHFSCVVVSDCASSRLLLRFLWFLSVGLLEIAKHFSRLHIRRVSHHVSRPLFADPGVVLHRCGFGSRFLFDEIGSLLHLASALDI